MSTDTKSRTRLVSLDALRGLAALSVVIFHYFSNFHDKYGHLSPPAFSFQWGRYGVELFFMISGFVIFLTLDRITSTAEFAFSRFSRLFPTYWTAVILTWGIVALFGLPGREVGFVEASVNLTMIQGMLGFPHVDAVYWTLQAELGFYLLAGLIYWSGQRQRGAAILALLVLVDCCVNWFGLLGNVPGLWRVYSLFPLDNLYLFLIGITIYEQVHSRISYQRALVLGAIAVIAAYLVPRPLHLPIVFGLAALVWIACVSDFVLLRWKWLIAAGKISYPLYLLHANIGYVIFLQLEPLGVPVHVAIGLAILTSATLAMAVSSWVEYPAMRWLRAQWKRRRNQDDSNE